jgi:DnaJ homolog subfamily C member 2
LKYNFLFYFYSADRKKVLKHHPDKKASSTPSEVSNSLYLDGVNQNTNDHAFFKCIQKADEEVLTNLEKRRQFDSVDPVFLELEDMPTALEIKVSRSTKAPEMIHPFHFCIIEIFNALAPVLELYSRFSKIEPVSSKGEVE